MNMKDKAVGNVNNNDIKNSEGLEKIKKPRRYFRTRNLTDTFGLIIIYHTSRNLSIVIYFLYFYQ